ncbi:aminoacyl-histidine dipeptidase [Micractinium conductrix]|uniref:Aminoacyl-histidine dipeptidase n=1 Tax=Micractinium conductrix TaxID=554055 RepID=A0A2P6UZD3_9CHLO|nr:aminoacyl-histidine dipeptidase [Micractinium conductrix]|eukprot:PSC67193.1 aminoacyl-histidine dipeptidase [Micractinium conductrix]
MPSGELPAALQGLEPEALWRHFGELSKIPRPSKHEGRVLDWLKEFAEERDLQWKQDAVGNIVIYRPGSAGGEKAAPVIVQGHVDMVCEKNAEVAHDFMADPIKLVRKDDWITADGTTLGSDNGIGVCAALALLDLPATETLPPLECLFTIDEETGLTGAFELDGSMLRGRTLLNLDTEDWGDVFIGCAGGGDSILRLDLQQEGVPAGCTALDVHVKGLLGGHSGINIHEDRGNAVRMAAATVEAILAAAPTARLVSMHGGDKRNAIPRECSATVVVPAAELDAAQEAVAKRGAAFQQEYGLKEPALSVSAAPAAATPAACLSQQAGQQLVDLLLTVPHGVCKNSHAVEGAVVPPCTRAARPLTPPPPSLVETSTNLAAVKPGEGGSDGASFTVTCSTRSSLAAPLELVRSSISRIGRLCGAEVEQDAAYPGWAPNPGSDIVKLTAETIGRITGKAPAVKAIHAGLECGIIQEKLPGLDSVSYGPTITGAHSPDEQVRISTVLPFWQATLDILRQLALA